MKEEATKFLVVRSVSVLEAMRRLEETERRIVFVVDDAGHLVGSLTDGDIRRWILAGGDLKAAVEQVCNKHPYTVGQKYKIADIRQAMFEKNIGCVPVVDRGNGVVDLLFWDGVFKNGVGRDVVEPVRLPVVIMAGGKGARLDPFTRVLPKPLIPVGDKTVIERIIDSFLKFGVSTFYISINHKSRIIESYFEELNPSYTVQFIREHEPLGTAGSLRELAGVADESIVVTNCDVIIACDCAELVKFHSENKNDITIVGSLKNYSIPYGVCHISDGGVLVDLAEKPQYNFLVNTGMYVLRTELIQLIPEGKVYHMTNLIDRAKETARKVAVFPVSDKAWLDTGQWEEYRRTLRELQVDYD